MIDESDGDFFFLGSLFSSGGVAVVLGILAIVVYLIAFSNETECSKKSCPRPTQTARLMDHECLCVEVAK
jgi:hypothetical protein